MRITWIIFGGLSLLALILAVAASQFGGLLNAGTFNSTQVRDTNVEPIIVNNSPSELTIDEFTKIEEFCLEVQTGCIAHDSAGKPPSKHDNAGGGHSQGHAQSTCAEAYEQCLEIAPFTLANEVDFHETFDMGDNEKLQNGIIDSI